MPIQPSEAHERVLYAAERLFAECGYHTVTVKDVAKAAGIHHASLYHHAPGGKAQLFAALPPSIAWERTTTLGRGGDRCDFCWRRVAGEAGGSAAQSRAGV